MKYEAFSTASPASLRSHLHLFSLLCYFDKRAWRSTQRIPSCHSELHLQLTCVADCSLLCPPLPLHSRILLDRLVLWVPQHHHRSHLSSLVLLKDASGSFSWPPFPYSAVLLSCLGSPSHFRVLTLQLCSICSTLDAVTSYIRRGHISIGYSANWRHHTLNFLDSFVLSIVFRPSCLLQDLLLLGDDHECVLIQYA